MNDEIKKQKYEDKVCFQCSHWIWRKEEFVGWDELNGEPAMVCHTIPSHCGLDSECKFAQQRTGLEPLLDSAKAVIDKLNVKDRDV